MSKSKIDFRDISGILQILRNFFLGRKYVFHNRFPPLVAPRSIPPADIPRGPDYRYANQFYHNRNVKDAPRPPVMAPVAQGPPPKTRAIKLAEGMPLKADRIAFCSAPTPGQPWWWDGHCYYETTPEPEKMPSDPCPPSSCPQPCQKPMSQQ